MTIQDILIEITNAISNNQLANKSVAQGNAAIGTDYAIENIVLDNDCEKTLLIHLNAHETTDINISGSINYIITWWNIMPGTSLTKFKYNMNDPFDAKIMLTRDTVRIREIQLHKS